MMFKLMGPVIYFTDPTTNGMLAGTSTFSQRMYVIFYLPMGVGPHFIYASSFIQVDILFGAIYMQPQFSFAGVAIGLSLPICDTYMGSVALIFYFPNDVLMEADTDRNGHIINL